MFEQKLDYIKTMQDLPRLQQPSTVQELGLKSIIIVLDDDPTGVQTVNNVYVYTDWSQDTILKIFRSDENMAFILSNSRGLSSAESKKQHEIIAKNIAFAAKTTCRDFILVSRSDSTLRGHYPLETSTLRDVLEEELPIRFDGEIICPFFCEGGRFTINDIHYVREGNSLIPAGLTEFAKDKTFGYSASSLPEWCEEKTNGEYRAENIISISIDMLRQSDTACVTEKLMEASNFSKIIVNAADYADIKVFILAYVEALKRGKRFIFRSAAAIPKILGEVADKPLLTKNELVDTECSNGGLIVIGSHVNKTTSQFIELMKIPGIKGVEFNQHRILEENGLKKESKRVSEIAEKYISEGITTVVYTKRARIDLPDASAEEQLEASVRISDAVTDVVSSMKIKPAFIIAKGGITSSNIGTEALKVKKAMVMGQVKPGIPVWMTGEESKFPGMPYVIFPGNVGNNETLAEIVKMLSGK